MNTFAAMVSNLLAIPSPKQLIRVQGASMVKKLASGRRNIHKPCTVNNCNKSRYSSKTGTPYARCKEHYLESQRDRKGRCYG